MARPKGSRTVLVRITYDTIGELAGAIAADAAKRHAQRGEFDSRDLESVLRWVNERRITKGLPLIGLPTDDGGQVISDAPSITSTPAPVETGSLLALLASVVLEQFEEIPVGLAGLRWREAFMVLGVNVGARVEQNFFEFREETVGLSQMKRGFALIVPGVYVRAATKQELSDLGVGMSGG